jgi:hypothetical protein
LFEEMRFSSVANIDIMLDDSWRGLLLPYLGEIFTNPGDFWSSMASPVFYSSRFFTPGLTESVEPLVWITYGLYASAMLDNRVSNTTMSGYEIWE